MVIAGLVLYIAWPQRWRYSLPHLGLSYLAGAASLGLAIGSLSFFWDRATAPDAHLPAGDATGEPPTPTVRGVAGSGSLMPSLVPGLAPGHVPAPQGLPTTPGAGATEVSRSVGFRSDRDGRTGRGHGRDGKRIRSGGHRDRSGHVRAAAAGGVDAGAVAISASAAPAAGSAGGGPDRRGPGRPTPAGRAIGSPTSDRGSSNAPRSPRGNSVGRLRSPSTG